MLRHVKKKRIKDAYPKKVCHMLRHVKKKRKKEKIAPYPKRKKNREMVRKVSLGVLLTVVKCEI